MVFPKLAHVVERFSWNLDLKSETPPCALRTYGPGQCIDDTITVLPDAGDIVSLGKDRSGL